MATGRTSVRQDIVAAVQNWLDRHAVKNLYEQFDFVDREKRGLEAIKSKIIGHCPELEQCNLDLRCVWGDLYRLELSKNDRECRISYYAKNEIPDTLVHWDGAVLFQVQTSDYEQLALALKRWLYDCAMPSDLEKEFPWIDIGKLAKYYEEGRGVEGEFLLSWEFVESFYTEWINHPNKREILELISKIKAHGYERTLRAGQSLYSLVLSRSRRHGLRQDQPWLTFDFRESGMDVRASFIKGEAIHFTSYEFIAELDALLRQLESMKID